MSGLSSFAAQQALYNKLTGDATLMGLVDSVHDRVPENTNHPYVTIGDMLTRDWSTKTTQGCQIDFGVHVWSRQGGRKQASTIMERIYDVLHDGTLTITDHTLVMMRYEDSDLGMLPDGHTYHGLMRFRAITEKN